MDGWIDGLLLAGKVDFKEQRSPLLPRKRLICARSDKPACALSFSIHKIDLQPAQRSDIAPLPAVSEDLSVARTAHRVTTVYQWLIDCWPLRTSCCFVAPRLLHTKKYIKISTTWLKIDVKRIHGVEETLGGPEGSCSLLSGLCTQSRILRHNHNNLSCQMFYRMSKANLSFECIGVDV